MYLYIFITRDITLALLRDVYNFLYIYIFLYIIRNIILTLLRDI